MKRPYKKPEVEKIEIDPKLIVMLTRDGFKEIFWSELAEQRKTNPKISARKVFDELNEKYYQTFGIYRYSDYDSFRRRIKKTVNKE